VSGKFVLAAVDADGEDTKRKPQVIRSGWPIPLSVDDDNSAEEIFPYICPRIDKQENIKGLRETVVTLLILFGVYGPGEYKDGKLINDGSGYRDVWNLIERTRQALFVARVIDNRYRIVEDFFEAEMLDEQVYPYWEGYCKVKFHVLFPLPKPSVDDFGIFERGV
jgi:hypothetical protein